MKDKHLIYTDYPNGKIKIVPKNGYKMYHLITKQYLSEAITVEKDLKWFVSEKDEN